MEFSVPFSIQCFLLTMGKLYLVSYIPAKLLGSIGLETV